MSSNGMEFQPKCIGREFVRCYYIILNRSPKNLHRFYDDNANFIHDDIDPMQRKTISVVGRPSIGSAIKSRTHLYRHTCTIVNGIDTVATIDGGLVVQVFGEIGYNGDRMRPFSQSFVLMAKHQAVVPHQKYFVLNDIFRFHDFLPGMERVVSEAEAGAESKAVHDLNATFMDNTTEPMNDHDNNVTTSETDAETINELQTRHLKSLLQETRPANHRKEIGSAVTVAVVAPMKIISNETAKQLFRDNCIITIGSVVNPSIKFDGHESMELGEKQRSVAESRGIACAVADISVTSNSSASSEQQERTESPVSGEIESNRHRERKNAASPTEDSKEMAPAPADIVRDAESMPAAAESTDTKPVSYAELLKLSREKSRSTSSSSLSSSGGQRRRSTSAAKDKPMIIRNSMRRKSDKQSSPNRDHQSRSDNIFQVFIGNIVQSATEEDMRRIFGKFGAITRFRMHSNPKKGWLPYFAFVTYENIEAVRRCLAKRNSLYYPESGPEQLKLNVNGDESIDVPAEEIDASLQPDVGIGPNRSDNNPSTLSNRRRDLKQFQKSFVLTAAPKETVGDKGGGAKASKIDSQRIKSHALESEQLHRGHTKMRGIAGKA